MLFTPPRTLTTTAFLTLFNMFAAAGPAEDIENALNDAPVKAMPRFYHGTAAPNLDHLRKKTTETFKVPTPASIQRTHVPANEPYPDFNTYKFSEHYAKQLKSLADICPALKTVDPQHFNTVSWFQRYVAPSDTSILRRDFIEALYFTMGQQPNGVEKFEAITELNKVLPDSPAFVEFLQKKRQELSQKLETDKFLTIINGKEKWKHLNNSTQEVLLNHISRLTLTTLLPNKAIDLPQVFVLNNVLSKKLDGLYTRQFNEIYLNGDRPYIRENYQSAVETVIHESFHVFHDILARWHSQNLLTGNAELDRQAGLYNVNSILGGTAISSHENYQGYRTGLTERSAWAFQLAGSSGKADHITTDIHSHLPAPILYRPNKEKGHLPAACSQ